MRRRDLIALAAGAAGLRPLVVRAQPAAKPVIGVLALPSPETMTPLLAAFRLGLGDTGYAEGRNVAIEYRPAEGHRDRLPDLAADLVTRKVDVIATIGGFAPAMAAKRATATIPVVFETGDDPVAAGLVASLARPGGNLTGVTYLSIELYPKRLELLSELVPQAKPIALLVNPHNPQTLRIIASVQEAARAKRVRLDILKAGSENEIDATFAALTRPQTGGIVVTADPLFGSRREQIIALAARYAIPAIYVFSFYAASGGLISYGASLTAVLRRLGEYAGKILRGSGPADLPVEQPTVFELVINLKTAKALGLTMPPSVLALANEVIE